MHEICFLKNQVNGSLSLERGSACCIGLLKIWRLADSALTEEVHDAFVFLKVRRLADSALTEEVHVTFVLLKLGRLTD